MKLEEYIKKFERRIQKYPDDWDMHRKIGKRLAHKLKKKVKRNSRDIKLINWCGIIALEINDTDLALEMFKRAVTISANVQTLNNLAYFYEIEYDDHQKVIELLEEVMKMNPSSALPYGLLSEAYLNLEEYHKAERVLRKAITFKETPWLLNNLGVSLYMQNNIKEALVYFRKTWELEDTMKDDDLNAMLSYGISLAQLGKAKEAEEVAEKLKLYVITYLEAGKDVIYLEIGFLEIAEIYYEAHNYKRANKMFYSALGPNMIYGNSPGWISQYQYSLIQCGRVQDAEDLLKQVILNAKKQMEEILEEDYYTPEDREYYLEDYAKDIEEYKDLFQKVMEGYRPPIDFHPRILGDVICLAVLDIELQYMRINDLNSGVS